MGHGFSEDDLSRIDPAMLKALVISKKHDAGMEPDAPIDARRDHNNAIILGRWAKGAPRPDRVENITVGTGNAVVGGQLFLPDKPAGRPLAIVIHGGGWTQGIPEGDSYIQGIFSTDYSIIVASPHYRMAPEYPYPAALDDCVNFIKGLPDYIRSLGIEVGPVYLCGGSAGANLALCSALRLRPDGSIKIAGLALFYGVFDCDFSTPSYVAYGDGRFGLSRARMREAFDYYAGGAHEYSNSLISPIHADLKGLPRIWLGAAELDVLLDDSKRLFEKLVAAGVSAAMKEYDGLTHGFTLRAGMVPRARAAIHDAAALLIEGAGFDQSGHD